MDFPFWTFQKLLYIWFNSIQVYISYFHSGIIHTFKEFNDLLLTKLFRKNYAKIYANDLRKIYEMHKWINLAD